MMIIVVIAIIFRLSCVYADLRIPLVVLPNYIHDNQQAINQVSNEHNHYILILYHIVKSTIVHIRYIYNTSIKLTTRFIQIPCPTTHHQPLQPPRQSPNQVIDRDKNSYTEEKVCHFKSSHAEK